jgi:hypothetical protein
MYFKQNSKGGLRVCHVDVALIIPPKRLIFHTGLSRVIARWHNMHMLHVDQPHTRLLFVGFSGSAGSWCSVHWQGTSAP